MKIQQLAQVFGYAGLVPFIVFSTATWISLPLVNNPHQILLAYAAVILSFMAAIHWGGAMTQPSEIARAQLGLSVLPALLGWLALLIPALYGYALLILCFIGLYVADAYVSDKGILPGWYLPMRLVLTTIVALCLAAAALAVLLTTSGVG